MPAKIRPQVVTATLVGLAVIAILLLAGVVALSGAEAASNVNCGDTITSDTTLHKDLVNCPNNGIMIGADGITLDLNGHTIDGDGTPAAGCDPITEFCDTGVVNFRHDGVTVKHGSMRQFAAGVNFGKVRHNRLLGISASRNEAIGFQFFNSSRILVRNCSGKRTSPRHEGTGIGVFDSRHVRIVNSSFRHNGEVGIRIADSTRDLIKGNLLARNRLFGIILGNSDHNQVRRNRLVRNGGGITLGPGSNNLITRNYVFRGREGIRIEKGHGNLVAHNLVTHTHHAGIQLGIRHLFIGGAHNVVRENVVKDTHVDGFLVGKKDRHSRLKGNLARGSGDDGFDVESRSAKLTKNRAVRNRDLGIEAVRGVIDGGGNIARHNGDPRQCTNIVCN
jgi:parallel beta-helix repeat protein